MAEIDIIKDIHESIRQATIEAKQNEALATKLISWFDSISAGNESLEDREAVVNRLNLVLNSIKFDSKETDNAE